MKSLYHFRIKKSALALSLLFMGMLCLGSSSLVAQHPLENKVLKSITHKTKKYILVSAHRAYHNYAPENSLSAIQQAIEAGIDFVEIDVRTTKDGVLVLMHDDKIDRTTNGSGKVRDLTYQELQAFHLKINDSVTNEKIPLLIDALKLAKNKLIPNLDLKDLDYVQLYKMLQSLGMEQEVISFIGKKAKVVEMLRIDSLYAVLPLSKSLEDVQYYISNDHSSLQHFTDETFTEDIIKLAKKRGQLIFVNTLWDEDEDFIKGDTRRMDKVIEQRPAIIQTDYPKLLVDYLRKKKLHP